MTDFLTWLPESKALAFVLQPYVLAALALLSGLTLGMHISHRLKE